MPNGCHTPRHFVCAPLERGVACLPDGQAVGDGVCNNQSIYEPLILNVMRYYPELTNFLCDQTIRM